MYFVSLVSKVRLMCPSGREATRKRRGTGADGLCNDGQDVGLCVNVLALVQAVYSNQPRESRWIDPHFM